MSLFMLLLVKLLHIVADLAVILGTAYCADERQSDV